MPKEKFERLVIEQVRERLLNQELDSGNDILKERLDSTAAELNDVQARLSKLYDALETSKLSLDDLASRVKDPKSHQEELTRARLQLQLEQSTGKARHLNTRMVKAYAEDLRRLVHEARVAESKAFLRSFISRIEINEGSATAHYIVPVPPQRGEGESVGVLPMVNLGGDRGIRTPDLCYAKAALSQLSYIPSSNSSSATTDRQSVMELSTECFVLFSML